MRPKDFLRRNAFNSLAFVGLLLPFADLVRREVADDRPAAAEAALAANTAAVSVGADAGSSLGAAPSNTSAPTSPDRKVERATEAATTHALAAVESAVNALASHVARSSHTDALRTAFQAYFAYRAANPEQVRKPYLYFVDLGLDNRTPRGYVFDMETLSVVEGPFMVAHGNGSGGEGVPTRFTNRMSSNSSSLGVYLAEETYAFSGKSAGRAYTSVGLRLRGESGEFNDAARRRGIVAHGAPYVTAARAGRSEGCPAMEPERAARLLPMIANGGVVFIYSPNDARWLGSDPWVRSLQAASN